MAYDQSGAAVGAAGHYAAAITSALITSGSITSVDDALDTFGVLLTATFASCEALKGEQPAAAEAPRRSNGYSRGGNRNGGGSPQRDPGTIDFRGGKYAGKTIAAVYDEDPEYLDWCVSNMNNEFMVGRIGEYLASVN